MNDVEDPQGDGTEDPSRVLGFQGKGKSSSESSGPVRWLSSDGLRLECPPSFNVIGDGRLWGAPKDFGAYHALGDT